MIQYFSVPQGIMFNNILQYLPRTLGTESELGKEILQSFFLRTS